MFSIIQDLLLDADLNCVVLEAAYAVAPSRTNFLLVAVLCRYKTAFKIKLVDFYKYQNLSLLIIKKCDVVFVRHHQFFIKNLFQIEEFEQ